MGALLSLAIFALDIWAIGDCLQTQTDNSKKILWILLILLLPVVGLILYFLLGKSKQ